jgi:hypothetical protein
VEAKAAVKVIKRKKSVARARTKVQAEKATAQVRDLPPAKE